MGKLGDVTIFSEKESGTHKVEATSYAVERGEPFTDHVAKRPSEFKLTGYILSDQWQNDLNRLIAMMDAGKIIKYVGKTTANDVIILDISEDHDYKIANGFAFSISLRRVRVTTTAWVKAPAIQKPNLKPETSSGNKKPIPTTTPPREVYHLVKKGDTYWALSKKYGTSVAQLRTWNKYADTRIPIGVKLRVK